MAKCPNCGSTNVEGCNGAQVAGLYALGAGGAVLAGAIGQFIGAGHTWSHATFHTAQEKIREIKRHHCKDCGETF